MSGRFTGGLLVGHHCRKVCPANGQSILRQRKQVAFRVSVRQAQAGMASTVSPGPKPIPLDVKVVLIGERIYYYLRQAYNPEFAKLFKVATNFEDDMVRSDETQLDYANPI